MLHFVTTAFASLLLIAGSGHALAQGEAVSSSVAVEITAPASATVGTIIAVSWSRSLAPDDFIAILAPDAEVADADDFIYARDTRSGELRAPALPGVYEVRYVAAESNEVMASAPIDIVDAEITISAPETVTVGAAFTVSWSETITADDFLAIVEQGAADGDYGDYHRARDATRMEMTAPSQPGRYEVRYLLAVDDRMMTSTPLNVTEADVEIMAPEIARTGEEFSVSWTGAVNPEDMVTVVPVGAPEGELGDYRRVYDVETELLTAPSMPGLYEVRYLLDQDSRTVASTPIEITEPDITLTAPETARGGSQVEVRWTNAVNANDLVTIVPVGAPDGEYGDYQRVRDLDRETLTAPAEPGLYEVRYLLDEGTRTMASAQIEITPSQLTISAPETVRAGEELEITWSETINPNDYVVIAVAGSDRTEIGETYQRAGDVTSVTMVAPQMPGQYEVRYLLAKGNVMLATDQLEVVAADAPIDQGAGLNVPATAAAGDTITVSWTAQIEGARVTLAHPDQADFTWIEAIEAEPDQTATFALPEEPGEYEVRFLDVAAQSVLGRVVVTAR